MNRIEAEKGRNQSKKLENFKLKADLIIWNYHQSISGEEFTTKRDTEALYWFVAF